MTAVVAQIIADAFARYRAAQADKGATEAPAEPSPIDRLRAHPQWSARDLSYFLGKGYALEEVSVFWDRDAAQGSPPVAWTEPEAAGKWQAVTKGRRVEILNGSAFILPADVLAHFDQSGAGSFDALEYRGFMIFTSDEPRLDGDGFALGPFFVEGDEGLETFATLDEAMALIDRGRSP